MKKTFVTPSLFKSARAQYRTKAKELKRRQSRLKAKFNLTVILPAFLMILLFRVIKVFAEIKARQIFANPKCEAKIKAGS